MSKSSVLAITVAVPLVAWAATTLTGEAADRPAERERPSLANDPAGLQRFLNGADPGAGRVSTTPTTTDHWIDPVCTGYGPGLGPPPVRIIVAEFAPSAASYGAPTSGRDASGACRPPSATGSSPPG